MRIRFILLAGALSLSATAAHAQQRALSDPVVAAPNPEALFTSRDAKLNRNKQAALHIQRELLKCHMWARAGEWLTDKYIQHNPNAQSGLQGVITYFTQVMKREPMADCSKLTTPITAVLAEGDLVTVVIPREYTNPNTGAKYTSTWFDMWRFVDGKADEHWDPATVAPAPAPAAR